MREIGVNLQRKNGPEIAEQIVLAAKAGFNCVFPLCQADSPLGEWRRLAEENGLRLETAHLPFGKMNDLWLEEEAGEAYLTELCRILDLCGEEGVPVAVVHTSIHTPPVPVTPRGLDRFCRLAAHAKDRGVRLAFENLEPQATLAAVLEAIPDYHGFCWDTGHNCCYTPQEDVVSRFGDRLLCVHLNDNRGVSRPGEIHFRDDLHLIPGDGVLNWDWVAEKLRGMPAVPLTMELKLAPDDAEPYRSYREMGFAAYLARAFAAASALRDKTDL